MFFRYFLRIFWLMHGVCSLPRPTLKFSWLPCSSEFCIVYPLNHESLIRQAHSPTVSVDPCGPLFRTLYSITRGRLWVEICEMWRMNGIAEASRSKGKILYSNVCGLRRSKNRGKLLLQRVGHNDCSFILGQDSIYGCVGGSTEQRKLSLQTFSFIYRVFLLTESWSCYLQLIIAHNFAGTCPSITKMQAMGPA